jgi:chromosome segregation ATPase
MEKLEKERALVHDLTVAKSTEESQVRVLCEQMARMEATITSLEVEAGKKALKVEQLECFVQELEQRNKALCRQLEQGKAQLDQLQGIQVDLMSQIGEKNKEIEGVVARLAEMEALAAEGETKSKEEKDQLLQEVAVAQQNIAELLGAKKGDVEVAGLTGQEPPTLPITHMAMVDRSAYEALQQAYENIEQMYHESVKENCDMHLRNVHKICQRRVAELTHRVGQCHVEYEAKCKELHEAKKQSQFGVGYAEEVAILRSKLTEMEENQEQVTKSLDSALQELASRREELKQKVVALAEAEDWVQTLSEALRISKEEFEQFQDRHDKAINEKRAKLDEHEATVRAQVSEIMELNKERAKQTHTAEQLQEQLQTLKQQAKSTERACPVCNTKFPGRISQQDFEKHVQGHFQQ